MKAARTRVEYSDGRTTERPSFAGHGDPAVLAKGAILALPRAQGHHQPTRAVKTLLSLALGVLVAGGGAARGADRAGAPTFTGMCDASAAVSVGGDYFLAANDENSVLRLYRASEPGAAVRTFDLGAALALGAKKSETDIEGGARLGEVVFWITSHARNAEGKIRESRDRFFAVRVRAEGDSYSVALEGQPYRHLLSDLLLDPGLRGLGFAEAVRKAPKEPGALNIEGLAATADQKLLIGFRNPVVQERALAIPLENPFEVVRGGRARFGKPIFLDLGKRGIREMILAGERYVIVAGGFDGKGKSRLYDWRGGEDVPRRLTLNVPENFNPEGLIMAHDQPDRLLLFSDDGSRVIDGCECKDLKDPNRRAFRALWVEATPK